MPIPKIIGAQRDFSFGEVDVALKRADEHPARKAGLRQMANCRILNSGAVQNRSGRRALFQTSLNRVEKFTISAGNNFKIGFGASLCVIISEAGSAVATFTGLPWTAANVQTIVWCQFDLSIVITFGHAMRPKMITWDGVSTWSIADFTELTTGNQKRTPFYRISPKGITLLPGAQTGTGVTLQASSALFTAGHVGTRMRFVNRQMLITAVTDSMNATVTIEEPLPGSQSITFGTDPTLVFAVGDVIRGSVSGSAGVVTQVTGSPGNGISLQLISTSTSVVQSFSPDVGETTTTFAFTTSDSVVGPGGALAPTIVTPIQTPRATTYWDDEIINDLQGYPASCFADQFRLGFCNFPAVPGGIAWSAIGSPTDLYVGVNADNALFEIVPSNAQVYFVVAGPESSEFVLCDTRIYYIPISPASPLAPGSVSFQILSGDGAAQVQPRVVQELILYANAGANSMMAIVATGAYYRPFNTREISKFHQHLFSGIQAIAAPTADGQFTERYIYVLGANNSLVVGKYDLADMTSETPKVGWGPWNGGGTVQWVAAWTGEVHFISSYFGIGMCERLDDTLYLDNAFFVNAPPTALAPPGGKGPLWFIPSSTVTLMDQGTRMMGTYQIDANGFIVPQNRGGEDLTVATLVAGQPWTGIVEPFVADAPTGNSVHQRMFKRRVSRMAVYAVNSSGLLLARLFSGIITPTSPPLGTIMNTYRIPTWDQGDNPMLAPPLREEAYRWRPLGRSYDPRVAAIKDTPGPLMISEFGIEATI